MSLPDHWWLLAFVVVAQGLFFVRIAVLRMRGKGVQPLARPALAVLALSGLAGLGYGFVQRDPLFVIGQACLLALYHCMQRERNDLR
ncbi:lipid A biosynthesis domain-containing protein [Desulfovibrio sp. Huiquan2017]|uniref:lipid A biosynthesis domain-containing protein n=1 Tax=Desulfovibrio sp. Huiquan2017 TaxID=2816861 RepID=UPI001A929AD4|nr:lipid A biosynthesis domain-containing protein [Desulfovibrio sp. Huiquan2017]